ncbi:ABC transporter thiamine pyrophosphate-binding lipoprotein p37/Cypl [Mycoplasmopsis gallopavonis]|uniref:High affinity transport system protein p37 n=1 Tax=Mycoplasmopsis gallopavonis TaxID=76629 RepID=A0A449AYW3_9BACT|nr:PhnD/SsuA/transferrin family substrate-binding protein [Mycoplasmopsis gallopavonis]RIV16877.1 hypothetical protein D1113_00630 [Mycoplasmopsis gallopavonis]VEU72665.1 High affinity transport system protein p37 precursor [Mycoplasmopsis gallopavonis]
MQTKKNKLIKKLINLASLSTLTIGGAGIVLSSCVDTKKETVAKVKLQLAAPYADADQIKTNLTKYLNDYLKVNKVQAEVELIFRDTDDYLNVKDSLLKGEIDFGFVSSGSAYKYQASMKQNGIKPLIQTTTRQFQGDITNSFYAQADEGNLNSLEQAARSEEELFNSKPRSNWNSEGQLGMNWNGSVYNDFYTNNQVDYQRGLVVVVANEEDTAKIEKAWKAKDLTTFVSFGLGIGKESSGSKYLLPQALFKKHFGSQFISFADLKAKKANILESKLKSMNDPKTANIHIFMENEGFYAWSKVKSDDAYTPNATVRNGQKISFLTLTDPLPYNVGLFSKNVKPEIAKAIANAFAHLTPEQNKWGEQQGFAGYRVIENPDQNYWAKIAKVFAND